MTPTPTSTPTSEELRTLLRRGRHDLLLDVFAGLSGADRMALARPLVAQADAVLSGCTGATVRSFLRDLRADYPGGRGQFHDAWKGKLRPAHWDAAKIVKLAALPPERAARIWPVPSSAVATLAYPRLFPGMLDIFVSQWAKDFRTNPKNWDRNRGREVLFEWIEQGLVSEGAEEGVVLMLVSHVPHAGMDFLGWLRHHPVVTDRVFRRIFTTPGVKGASPAATDETTLGRELRGHVIPGLIREGTWTPEFLADGIARALDAEWPPYQRRWFEALRREILPMCPLDEREFIRSP